MKGKAVSYGAISIINAISCGFGAAFGVKLKTEATVNLTDNAREVTGRIISDPSESTLLIKKTVKHVFRHFKVENRYGAHVETRSNIPIAKGLKSSSAAANAIVLATASALQKDLSENKSINLGVDASLEAGVTITGAFDDACASFYGGLVVTDNNQRRILKRIKPKSYSVLIYVPKEKAYTADSDVKSMRILGREIKSIHKLTLSDQYWQAMTINGMLYSAVLGYDVSTALEALSCGAIAAGLTGKGPAVAAVATENSADKIRDLWKSHGGRTIQTEVNNEEAHRIQ